RRAVADKNVALSVDEQVGALRREIAVATPQPGILVAPVLRQALLCRAGRGSHELQASRVGDSPGTREVDHPEEPTRDRVVYRRAGADPFAMVMAEVLECEHLHRVVRGQRGTDAVRAVDRFAAPRTLDEIHLRGPLL